MTEVAAAFWGKVRQEEIDAEVAAVLDQAFVADLVEGRFAVVPLTEAQTAISLQIVRRHELRGADAVQLAAATAARTADSDVDTVAAFDQQLRAAAAAEGFALLPAQR